MADNPQPRLAVLIDADNTQPAIASALLAEIAKYGVASVRRVYGDWTGQQLRGWKDVLNALAIQPVQQFGYTTGKNATDSAMIIDAMDLLYTQRFDGFCLVSSDSDFTRLASRLRESGLTVYGFGERKTPQSLVSACDRFVYLEVLRAGDKPAAAKPAATPRRKAPASPPAATSPKAAAPAAEAEPAAPARTPAQHDPELLRLLREALDDAADDDGWAHLGAVGSLIAKRAPNFDSRNYGFRKLSDLVPALGIFQVEKRGPDGTQIHLRHR